MKKILYSVALLISFASCSKEEEVVETIPAEKRIFYLRLNWASDSLVSYGGVDLASGPIAEINTSAGDPVTCVTISPRFTTTNNPADEPYMAWCKNGTEVTGFFMTPVNEWVFSPKGKEKLYPVRGTEVLIVDRFLTHPEWGEYVEGRIRYLGYHSSNPSREYEVLGTFRARAF
jgi:hypothetical protein